MNKQAAILLSLTGFLVITSMYVYTHLGVSMDTDNLGEMNYHLYHEEPIDVVYTWVNGSDPVWLKEMLKFKRLSNGSTIAMVDEDNVDSNKTEDTASANRYRDNHELKYSIRSLFKYAPWIRHIYLVTNGQVSLNSSSCHGIDNTPALCLCCMPCSGSKVAEPVLPSCHCGPTQRDFSEPIAPPRVFFTSH